MEEARHTKWRVHTERTISDLRAEATTHLPDAGDTTWWPPALA